MADGVLLSPEAAQRMAAATRRVEKMGVDVPPAGWYPYVPDDSPEGIKRGTFTAPWNKGAKASVTDATDTTVKYDAHNFFANVSGTGTKSCAIAKVGDEWILIAAEC